MPPTANGLREGTNPFLIAVVVGLAAFMEVLDISIANVSLQHIAGSLSAGQEESTWVLTSYLVANAIVLPMSGWFSMLLGRRRFYLISISIFTVSSLLCGLAPSLEWLIFFRVLQGLGGGALQPVSQSILSDAFPPEKRGIAFAIYGMSVVAAPAIGPTLGGWITDNFSWHWIFLINVPIGILLLSLSRMLIRDPAALVEIRERKKAAGFHIDYIGFGLIALGLGALQLVLDKGQSEDWFQSPFIVACAWMAAVALVVACVWEWYQKEPVVNLKLMKDRNFAVGMGLMFMLGLVLIGTTVLMPLMTQTLFGYTSTRSGMVLSPGGFMIMLLMPLVGGVLINRVDPRGLIAFGLTTVCVSMFYMSTLELSADFSTLMWARVLQTFGLAFLFLPINMMAFVGVTPTESGNASALINLSRNIGGSVGISILTTQLARGAQQHQAQLVENHSVLNPAYQDAHATLAPVLGDTGAHAALYGQLQEQALLLSFLDDFRMLGVALLFVIPAVLIMRRPPKDAAAPADAH